MASTFHMHARVSSWEVRGQEGANVYILSAGHVQNHVHRDKRVAQSDFSLWGLRGVPGPEDSGPKGQLEGFLVSEALGTVFCEVH